MRVVLLPSAFSPRIGGVEVLTDRLARTLQRSGHEVEVWTARTRGDDLLGDEVIDGLRVRRFTFDAPRAQLGAMTVWPGRAVDTVRRMRAAVREFRPDLLHVQCFSGNGVYATLLSAITRTPLVVTLQGETFMDDHDIYARSLYLRRGLRVGLRRARQVTGCSRYTLDDAAVRFDAAAARGRVIFNGVDQSETPAGDWQPPFQRFVLGLGRVVHRKGFDLLIEAFSRVAERDPALGLVIGGEGPDLPSLRALADDRSLRDRVCFAGALSRPHVADAMRAAEVFVMPSRVEAFGIVVLEAWKAGTPAIVTANGGPPEFVRDGIDGLVVDPLDVDALAQQLDRLLGDPKLQDRLVAAGAERVAAFGWPEIARQYEDVYTAALAGR